MNASNPPYSEELATEFGRALTDIYAPEEAELFDELILKTKQSKHPLRFGVNDVVTTASPYFAAIGALLVPILADQMKTLSKDVAEAGSKIIRERIVKWINSHFQSDAPAKIPHDQLTGADAIVDEALKNKAIDATTANILHAFISEKLKK